MSASLVTKAIKEALAIRFGGIEWACFFEVAMGTGYNGRDRTADAIAMNMYPSRGLALHGIEIKASRSDWLRELKQPDKADAICRFCDHWWIAAQKDIVKREELPPTWGLLELNGKGLRQAVAAPRLSAEPMERSFIASLLRSAAGKAERETRVRVEAATRDIQAKLAEKQAVDIRTRESAEAYERLRANVDAFVLASGIDISNEWKSGKALGDAVKLVQALGIERTWGLARDMTRRAREFAERVDPLLAAFDAEKAPGDE